MRKKRKEKKIARLHDMTKNDEIKKKLLLFLKKSTFFKEISTVQVSVDK